MTDLFEKMKALKAKKDQAARETPQDEPEQASSAGSTVQCPCGSSLAGECAECDADNIEDPEIVARLKNVGVNPPAPTTAELPDLPEKKKAVKQNAAGTCPFCDKEFKNLNRHKCKKKPAELNEGTNVRTEIVDKDIDRQLDDEVIVDESKFYIEGVEIVCPDCGIAQLTMPSADVEEGKYAFMCLNAARRKEFVVDNSKTSGPSVTPAEPKETFDPCPNCGSAATTIVNKGMDSEHYLCVDCNQKWNHDNNVAKVSVTNVTNVTVAEVKEVTEQEPNVTEHKLEVTFDRTPGFDLYIDILIERAQDMPQKIYSFDDFIKKFCDEVNEGTKEVHWKVVEYAKGAGYLIAVLEDWFKQNELDGILIASSSSLEFSVVQSVLKRNARNVLQGV